MMVTISSAMMVTICKFPPKFSCCGTVLTAVAMNAVLRRLAGFRLLLAVVIQFLYLSGQSTKRWIHENNTQHYTGHDMPASRPSSSAAAPVRPCSPARGSSLGASWNHSGAGSPTQYSAAGSAFVEVEHVSSSAGLLSSVHLTPTTGEAGEKRAVSDMTDLVRSYSVVEALDSLTPPTIGTESTANSLSLLGRDILSLAGRGSARCKARIGHLGIGDDYVSTLMYLGEQSGLLYCDAQLGHSGT